MTVSLSTPVTGGPQTGFTSPTYTVTADTYPDFNGKALVVSALGGTQTGVTVHSASSPFSIAFTRPKSFRMIGPVVPNTGRVKSVPNNTYKTVVRKGVLPLAGQPTAIARGGFFLDIPAGSDLADAANLRALVSLLIGALWQVSAGLGDTIVTGSL